MAKKVKKKAPKAPGPAPERLRLEGDWEDRVDDVLRAVPPPGGWPHGRKKKGKKAGG